MAERYINPKIRPSQQEMMDRLMTIADMCEKSSNAGEYPNADKFLIAIKRIALDGGK